MTQLWSEGSTMPKQSTQRGFNSHGERFATYINLPFISVVLPVFGYKITAHYFTLFSAKT
jgi:hypothetical protein